MPEPQPNPADPSPAGPLDDEQPQTAHRTVERPHHTEQPDVDGSEGAAAGRCLL